jgi:hypothetical protein
VSLSIPTDSRAAVACILKSLVVSGVSDKDPGGTTGEGPYITLLLSVNGYE